MKNQLTWRHKLYLWRRGLLNMEFSAMVKGLRGILTELRRKDKIAFANLHETTNWSREPNRATRMRQVERIERRTRREFKLVVFILGTVQNLHRPKSF